MKRQRSEVRGRITVRVMKILMLATVLLCVEALRAEVATLRRAGIETIVVQASAGAVEAARGFPRRKPEAAPAIVRHAVEATQLALASA